MHEFCKTSLGVSVEMRLQPNILPAMKEGPRFLRLGTQGLGMWRFRA